MGGLYVHLCIQNTEWEIHINVALFPAFIAAVDIGVLALGSGSYCVASPSSGGMELCITFFVPNVVVNYIYSVVLEGAACEPLLLLPFHQQ